MVSTTQNIFQNDTFCMTFCSMITISFMHKQQLCRLAAFTLLHAHNVGTAYKHQLVCSKHIFTVAEVSVFHKSLPFFYLGGSSLNTVNATKS